jgi:hypothetical protein
MENRRWLDAEVALHSVGAKAFDEGLASLNAILDRLAAIKQQDKTSNIRKALLDREREIRGVASEYGALVRSLGDLSDADRWEDAVIACYQQLAVAYSKLLDDLHQAMRLIVQVWDTAHDPQLRQALQQERNSLSRTILCREAEALLRSGDFTGAEFKLVGALANSTDEQKSEILAMQDRCRWARVLENVDTSQKTPLLRAVLGSGTVLRGKHNEDYPTRSYIARHWLTLFYFPVFPLGAYRVSETEAGGQRIHGRATLTGPLGKARWAILFLCIALLAAVPGSIRWKKAHATVPSVPAVRAEPPPQAATPATPPPAPAQPLPTQQNQAAGKQQVEVDRDSERVSLDKEKALLDAEAADLAQQKYSLDTVAAEYQKENVPAEAKSVYERLLAEHVTKAEQHREKLAAWRKRSAAYDSRADLAPQHE